MKKVININLAGRLISIEDTAYELLKKYLDQLNHYFGREEGGDEIVSDIEDRIAELFQEKLRKGTNCITDRDVDAMVETMGRPEQLEEETSTEPQEKTLSDESRDTDERNQQQEAPKRLSRNKNDQLIGGVCSGIANYFDIDPAIIRIITFLLILAYGVGLMAYIILWIALPGDKKASTGLRRRLYRDTEHKVIGGVASGIGAYFKIDPVIPRIVFVLPLLGMVFSSIFRHSFHLWGMHTFVLPFSLGAFPTLVILYIILWIAVPRAVTQAEKLEMRGEKVDLQSLSNAHKSTGDEKKKLTPEATSTPPTPAEDRKRHSGIGEIFGLLVKIVLYFILGIILISVCGVLIAMAAAFLGVSAVTSVFFPFKSVILGSPLQDILVWPATILTLGIPVIGLIWLLVKLIGGLRHRFRYVGLSLFILWLVGVACTIGLVVSVARDFRMHYAVTKEVPITQPENTLILRRLHRNGTPSAEDISVDGGWLQHFFLITNDSIMIDPVKISIQRSDDSDYHVKVVYASNGRSIRQAKQYVNLIPYAIRQKDSVLYIPVRFMLQKNVPFRNQHILLKIFVPSEKSIELKDHLEELENESFERHWEEFHEDFDSTGGQTKYRMTLQRDLLIKTKDKI